MTDKPMRSTAAAAAARPDADGLLPEAQRKALIAELDREHWKRVRDQCSQRSWPGRLQAWDVSPDGRVLAGVVTERALVWLDAGPAPAPDPADPRLQMLLRDQQARDAQRQKSRGMRTPIRRR